MSQRRWWPIRPPEFTTQSGENGENGEDAEDVSAEKLSHEIQAMTVMNQNKRTKTGLPVSFPPSLALILKGNVLIEIMKERCAGAPQATRADKIALPSICERGAVTVFGKNEY